MCGVVLASLQPKAPTESALMSSAVMTSKFSRSAAASWPISSRPRAIAKNRRTASLRRYRLAVSHNHVEAWETERILLGQAGIHDDRRRAIIRRGEQGDEKNGDLFMRVSSL